MIDVEVIKIKKHRSTLAPFECLHCEYIWYGWDSVYYYTQDMMLCLRCWSAIERHMAKKYDGLSRCIETENVMRRDARSWIEDKTNKPHTRAEKRRFHSNVPKWMRSAIVAGLVKTNSEDVYVVYSQDQDAMKVDIVDESTLRNRARR